MKVLTLGKGIIVLSLSLFLSRKAKYDYLAKNELGWILREMEIKNRPILLVFFIRLQYCINSYVARYAPISTVLKTNKNPAQYWTIIYFQLPNGSI